MESQSPTEMKNSNTEKHLRWHIWLLILVCLLPTVFFMCMDTYRTGDEIVTYGMANEPAQGWMFSKGRIRSYLDAEIFGDGAGAVPGNLIAAAKDVLQNRKNAAFFQMERPGETGWYTGAQMQQYLTITEGEAFQPGKIYLNGMGDDANSFLYYLCLHLVSSLFPGISATKWSGYILNLICLAAALFLLERIAAFYVKKTSVRYGILFVYACSAAAVSTYTNIRPYALAVVMQEALFLLHLKMLQELQQKGAEDAKRYFKWLLPAYMIGYVTHYTTGIWAGCLALFTIASVTKEKKFLRSYVIVGILAVLAGICLDPMSVLGLLSKLKGTESSGLGSIYAKMFRVWGDGIFGNPLWLIPTAALYGVAGYRYQTTEISERPQCRGVLLFAGLPLGYMLLSTFLMKSDRIAMVLPYFFVLLGMLISYTAGEKKRWKYAVGGLCFVLWAIGMFSALVTEKKEERKDYLLLEELMAQQEQESIVFLRDHGAGYDKIPLLAAYDKIFLWTADEGWTDHAGDAEQALQNGGLILLDGSPESLWREATAAGLADGAQYEVLFGNAQVQLIRIE